MCLRECVRECVRACVPACVRACVRVCVCVCVCVCVFSIVMLEPLLMSTFLWGLEGAWRGGGSDTIFHLDVHYVCYNMLVQRFEP